METKLALVGILFIGVVILNLLHIYPWMQPIAFFATCLYLSLK